MPSGTTLVNLLSMWKAIVGNELDESVAPGGDSVARAGLANTQKWLATEYDWPQLEVRSEVNMAAGTRYYDFPVDGSSNLLFELDREIKAECYWSNLWYSVLSGIKLINYNTLNPELGQRLDPVIRWQLYNSGAGNKTQFEVWPLPATATRLRLTGQRPLKALVADSDVCDLDDMLIALFYAAEYQTRTGQGDAQAQLAKAQKRLQRLRGGIESPSQVFVMGGNRRGERRHSDRYDRPMVGVNYTPPT